MINLYSQEEIARIRIACIIVCKVLDQIGSEIKADLRTSDLNKRITELIHDFGGEPAFLGYRGYPAESCISVNEVVVHGIPGKRRLKEGDIVSVDIGVIKDGFFGDAARTFPIGNIGKEKERLMRVTKQSLINGIGAARLGNSIADISAAIEDTVTREGCMPVRELVGHGIGRNLHEDPQVPNFRSRDVDHPIRNGMVLAIEPMINLGHYEVDTLDDDWTVVTRDRKPSAHFEHTVAIINGAAEILTVV